MASTTFAEGPPISYPIHTLDDERIGHVREVRGRFFMVAALTEPDFWLPDDCIGSVTDRVMLNFNLERLADHKLSDLSAA